MCGKNCGQKLKRIGLLLLLCLLVSLPSYSVDIEQKDWEIVSSYVLTSEKVLPQLSQTLKTVETRLEQSESELTSLQNKQSQLETSLENMEMEIQTLTKKNNRLQIISTVGLTVGIVGIAGSLVMLFLN